MSDVQTAGANQLNDVAPEDDLKNWQGFHPGYSPWAIAMVVTMATFMEVLDTSIANVALPHISGGLSSTQEESTWILTAYLLSNAVVLPISGWLASRIGRKRFYMICVFLFTVSSFLCGIAPNLGMLIFFRILQGIGGGGLAPSEQSILADTFPPAKRGLAMAMYGMAVVMAPAIGPTLGGFITDHFSWRWIFFINVPVGILSLFLTQRMIQDPPYLKKIQARKTPIDYIGLGLITVGLGCLQVVLDKGQQDDWFSSPLILGMSIIAAITIIVFIVWEWFQEHPIIELRLFKNRNFAVANFFMFMLGFSLFSTTVLLPQFLQLLMGYTAEQSGQVLSPGGITIMFMMPLVAQLIMRVDARWMIVFGFFILSMSLFNMTQINLGIDFQTAMYWRIFQSVGLAFLFVPINTMTYVGIPREKNNQVSGMINLFRNIGGSVGISLVTTLLARRAQMHQTNLVGHANAYNLSFTQMVQGMSSSLQQAGLDAHTATQQAYARLYGLIQVQSLVLSYIDIFWMMGIFVLCLIPLVFLMKKNTANKQNMAAH